MNFNLSKKTISLLLSVFFLMTGCSVKEVTDFGSDNTFSYKEKCAKYNSIEKERMEEEWSDMTGDLAFNGIFYSRKLETCISEWLAYNLGPDGLEEMYMFYDVLTEKQLGRFNTADVGLEIPYQQNNEAKTEEFREDLELVR